MSAHPVTIRRYDGRRFYSPEAAAYVTLEDLAGMVEDEQEFVVYDAKTEQDITGLVLRQIIRQQARHG